MSSSDGFPPPTAPAKNLTEPRVIDGQPSIREQLTAQHSSIDSMPWASGVLAALQSVLFGLAIIVIPVLTTAAISTTLLNQDFEFGPSFVSGLAFWVLGHGAQIVVSGSAVSLVPVGLTLLVLVAGAISVHRTARPGLAAAASYLGTYLIVALGLSLAVGSLTGGSFVRLLLTTVVISACALALGLRKRKDAARFRGQIAAQVAGIPGWIRLSVRAGVAGAGAMMVAGAVVVLAWFALSMNLMNQVLQQWSLDAPSGIALGVAQTALVPNLVVWATSYASGGSFSTGADTVISLTQTQLGALPAIPMLAALPAAPAWPVAQILAPLAIVGAAALGAALISRSKLHFTALQVILVPVIAAVVLALIWGALFVLGSGAAGPGRLAFVGVSAPGAMARLFLMSLAGMAVVIVATRAEVRHGARSGWAKLKERISRVDESEYDAPEPRPQAPVPGPDVPPVPAPPGD